MTETIGYLLYAEPLSKGGVMFARSDVYTNVLDIDPANFFWDNTNKYLGIGTSTPAAPFSCEGGAIFNDLGAAVDFRVEGDTDANLLFIDGSADFVGFGTNAPGAKIDVRGGAIFNEDSASVDFRIESDSNTHMFFVDGSADKIGINHSTPGHTLDVNGDLACTRLFGTNQTQNADDTLYLGEGTSDHNFFLDRSIAGGQMIIGYNTPIDPSSVNGIVQIYNNSTDRLAMLNIVSKYNGGGQNEFVVNDSQGDVNFRWETDAGDYGIMGDATNANVTINAASVSAHYDLMLAGDGVLGLKETTTPTADTSYGKIYNKTDNYLYFQDGAGVEHKVHQTAADVPIVDAGDYYTSTEVETALQEIGALSATYILHSLADAANDFLVASAADTFVKKTLAETGAILEGDIDHDNLVGFASNEHYLQTSITNVSTALATGLLKVTTTTGALSVITDSSSNWDSAYTHIGESGASHTYIDQSVISGATPTFTGTSITAVASITAADESADTSCFPLFATTDTGTVEVKTGSNLTFNSSTGLFTATGISGTTIGGITEGNLVDKSASETIGGEWTYSTFPITPSAAPDANYEVANKKYIDDHASDTSTHGVATAIVGTTETQTLINKTLTSPILSGQISGWVVTDPLTYASETTFTISGDWLSRYQKGDKMKLTQTTTKYFYIINTSYSFPDTTVTITGGSDYTLANAAITDPFYSHFENPHGFPEWFNYTESYTGFSSNPTMNIIFCLKNKTCFIKGYPSSAGTSNATNFKVSLPIAPTTTGIRRSYASGIAVDNGAGTEAVFIVSGADDATNMIISKGVGASGAWTASGTKYANVPPMFYEIA